MKFTVVRSVLLEALSITGKCIASRSIISMLDNYLLEIDSNKLTITASNNEVFMTTSIDIVGDDFKVSVALLASQLLGLVKDLPEQPIQFAIDKIESELETGYRVKIQAGKGIYNIPAEDGSYFPDHKNEKQVVFELPSGKMIEGIEKTMFACSTDQLRPKFTGVNIILEDNKVTFTATNANILSTFEFEVNVTGYYSFIIPQKVLSILLSTPREELLKLEIDKNSIAIHLSQDTILKSLLIDEKYVDYKSVIPSSRSNELVFDRLELIGALKRVVKFSNDITYQVELDIKSNKLFIRAENVDFAKEASEEISAELSGEEIKIGLPGRFTIDCLNRLQSKDVYMYYSTPNRAVVLKENQAESLNESNLMLVMPVMLNSYNG